MKKTFYAFIIFLALISIAYVFTPSEKLFKLALSIERSIAGLELKKTNISEGEIYYLEGGVDQTETLLLLHGFGANKDNWTRLAKHLTKQYHIIAIDLPGFGDSFKNIDLNYDVLNQVNRVNEIVSILNLKQFHIGGNSMGGYIAGNYAVAFPNQVKTLWLLNPLGIASAPNSEMSKMIQQNHPPAVLAKNPQEYENLISFVFYKQPFIPSFMIDELAKQAENNYQLHAKIFKSLHQVSQGETAFTSALDTVLINFPKPVLITWGDKDRVLHPLGATKLAEIIPNTQVNMMQNIGHLPMIEAPDTTAKQFILFNKTTSH